MTALATRLEPEEIRLLSAIGLRAVLQGDPDGAEPIFVALCRERPGHALGETGLALCALARGEAEAALQKLERIVLDGRSGSAAAEGIALLMLSAVGRGEDAQERAGRLAASDDPQRRQVAALFLGAGAAAGAT